MTSTIPRSQKKWIYLFLKQRDGHSCSKCMKKESELGKLEIHHIDENPSNQDPPNLRLLCHSCHIKVSIKGNDPKHYGIFVEREGENLNATAKIKAAVDYQQGSPEMQANDYYELEFRNYIIARLKRTENHKIEKDDAISSGAERTGASINACRNYLMKMASSEGPCYEAKLPSKTRVIRLRSEFEDESHEI